MKWNRLAAAMVAPVFLKRVLSIVLPRAAADNEDVTTGPPARLTSSTLAIERQRAPGDSRRRTPI
jgi:hypothetical protein